MAFNPERDFLSLHHDYAPDGDDYQATAANITLAKAIGAETYVFVSGAYGPSSIVEYDHKTPAFNQEMFEEGGIRYIDAHADYSADLAFDQTGKELGSLWLETINNGSRVWVSEGGQSDVSLEAAKYVAAQGGDTTAITIVQHSFGNISQEGPGVQEGLQALGVEFIKVDNGNFDNATADLRVENGSAEDFELQALSSPYSREWEIAIRYFNDSTTKKYGVLDFSDSVATLQILGVTKEEVGSHEDFANMFFGDAGIDLTSGTIDIDLYDAAADLKVADIMDGGTVFTSTDLINRTIVASYEVDAFSVGGSFALTLLDAAGNVIREQVENNAPYAIFGDDSGNFSLGTEDFSDGGYQLKVDVFSGDNLSGALLASQSLSFDIVHSAAEPQPNSELPPESSEGHALFEARAVDAVTGQEFAFIADGASIFDNGVSPENRTIKVDYVGDFTSNDDDGSLLMELFDSSGALVHAQTESFQPYALFGDNMKGQYKTGVGLLNDGAYRLELTMFDRDYGLGSVIGRECLNFTFFSA